MHSQVTPDLASHLFSTDLDAGVTRDIKIGGKVVRLKLKIIKMLV